MSAHCIRGTTQRVKSIIRPRPEAHAGPNEATYPLPTEDDENSVPEAALLVDVSSRLIILHGSSQSLDCWIERQTNARVSQRNGLTDAHVRQLTDRDLLKGEWEDKLGIVDEESASRTR